MWRQRIRRTGADLFTSFLKLIAEKQREVTPPEELPKVWLFFSLIFLIIFAFKNIYLLCCHCSILLRWILQSGIASTVVIRWRTKRSKGFMCRETAKSALHGRTFARFVDLSFQANILLQFTWAGGVKRGLPETDDLWTYFVFSNIFSECDSKLSWNIFIAHILDC